MFDPLKRPKSKSVIAKSSGAPLAKIEPRWVVVEEELCLVSDFAALPSRERPPARCPLCELPVVLKLGQVKAHHYAHAREAECAASQPETALHLNTKFHFYRQLKQAQPRELWLEETCERCQKKKRRHLWARDWDEVQVEYRMASARPDIALLLAGQAGSQVMGALEILVTHAVDERKAAYLGEQGVPWLEISATPQLYLEPTAWTTQAPLPVLQLPFPVWTCPSCARELEQQRLEKEQRAAQRKAERERIAAEQKSAEATRYEVETHAAVMVDFYHPGNKKYREIFYVNKGLRGGIWIESWVEDRKHRRLHQVRSQVKAPLDNRALHPLKRWVENHLAQQKSSGRVVDVVAPWRLWRPGQKFVARNFDRYPYRYEWNEGEGKWIFQGQESREERVVHQEPVDIIVRTAQLSTDPRTRAALLAILQEFPARQVERALRAFLQDPSEEVRAAAQTVMQSVAKGPSGDEF